MEWWVYRDGDVSNRPLTKHELREKEYVTEDTYVCRTERDSWVRAGDDPELKSIFQSEDKIGDAESLELDDEDSTARATPAFNVDHTVSETEDPESDQTAPEPKGHPGSEESSFRSQSDILATSIWRRPLAFVFDYAIFYCLFWAAGVYYSRTMMEFHASGIVIGHSVFFLYLAFFNSEYGGSGSLGKKLLGLRVKGEEGYSLSFFVSFWRYFLLLLPFVLWSVVFTKLLGGVPDVVHVALGMIAVFFVIALVYLYFFNAYRRTLHDCITTTAVVREKPHDVLNFSFMRGHLYFIGILFALSIYGLSVVFAHYGGVVPILSLQKSILEEDRVLASGLPVYRNLWEDSNSGKKVLYVRAWLEEHPSDRREYFQKLVKKTLHQNLLMDHYRKLDIGIGTGINFGIYSNITYEKRRQSIPEWREFLKTNSDE